MAGKKNISNKPAEKHALVPKSAPARPDAIKDIWHKDKTRVIIIAIVAFLLYVMSVNNGYAIDDILVIQEHPIVSKGISGIPELLVSPYIEKLGNTVDYRPITLISYAIEQSLFGGSPSLSHFINVTLYALLCVFLYLFLRKFFPFSSREFIFLGTVIFIVHPLHAEVVNNLKSRDELFSLLFGLAFIWFALKNYFSSNPLFPFLAVFFLLLSLMSKISSIPLLMFFYVYILYAGNKKVFDTRLLKHTSFYFLFTGIYIILVNKVFFNWVRIISFYEFPLVEDGGIKEHLAIIIPTILFYVKMMILPYPLSSYYGYNALPAVPVVSLQTLACILFLVCMGWLIVSGFRERKISSFLSGWFIISGVIYYNIFTPYMGIVSERAALLMSIPGCLGIAMIAGQVIDRKNISLLPPSVYTRLVLLFVVLGYGYISFQRINDWKSMQSLLTVDLAKYPNSSHLNYMMAMGLNQRLKEVKDPEGSKVILDSAEYYFSIVSELDPDQSKSLTFLGRYQIDYHNNMDSAIFLLSQAWNSNRTGKVAYEMSRAQIFKNKWEEAIPWLEFARKNDTSILYAAYFLSQAYFETGRIDDAYSMNEQLLDSPEMIEPYHLNKAMFLGKEGKFEAAYSQMKEAVELGNRDPKIIYALYSFYRTKGDMASLRWLEDISKP